jgi:hypothetical protein
LGGGLREQRRPGHEGGNREVTDEGNDGMHGETESKKKPPDATKGKTSGGGFETGDQNL